MTDRFLSFIPFIVKWEGTTYENDPDDNGGATKFGIDQRSHPNENIRKLTLKRAQEIYFKEYWTAQRCDDLPAKVGEVVMNIGVNAGKARAGKWLQRAVATTQDGIIGPGTVLACKSHDPEKLALTMLDRMEEHYRSIAHGRLSKFLKGWLNRNNDLRKYLKL